MMSGASPRERQRQPLAQSALRWSLLGMGALVLTLGTNVFRPTIRGLQLSADIVQRSRQYHTQISNNDALEQENAFLRSNPGKQWAVRRYTGMLKPGETVGQAVEESAGAPGPQTKRQRVRNWIAQRETCGANCLHETAQVIGCYAKLRPPDESPNDRNRKKNTLSKHRKTVSK